MPLLSCQEGESRGETPRLSVPRLVYARFTVRESFGCRPEVPQGMLEAEMSDWHLLLP